MPLLLSPGEGRCRPAERVGEEEEEKFGEREKEK
jgi:hypothetical protein